MAIGAIVLVIMAAVASPTAASESHDTAISVEDTIQVPKFDIDHQVGAGTAHSRVCMRLCGRACVRVCFRVRVARV